MATEELWLRRGVVVASGLAYWAGVYIQARRVKRHIGKWPNVSPRGTKERALWIAWFLVVAVWLAQPWIAGSSSSFLATRFFDPLSIPLVLILGLLLIASGYAATLWCYKIMGDAWRMGTDPADQTALVRRGPYARIRHPIYAFQLVILGGVALLLPTILSLSALVLHFVCILIKATDEESFLLKQHGQSYRDYCAQTGWFLPRLGLKKP